MKKKHFNDAFKLTYLGERRVGAKKHQTDKTSQILIWANTIQYKSLTFQIEGCKSLVFKTFESCVFYFVLLEACWKVPILRLFNPLKTSNLVWLGLNFLISLHIIFWYLLNPDLA